MKNEFQKFRFLIGTEWTLQVDYQIIFIVYESIFLRDISRYERELSMIIVGLCYVHVSQ